MYKQFYSVFLLCHFLLLVLAQSLGRHNIYLWNRKYDAVLLEENKQCNYQSRVYVIEDFFAWAGYGCYIYSNGAMFKDKPLKSETVMGKKDKIPVGKKDGEIFLFDYKNTRVQEYVLSSYKKEKYLHKWINCCKMAEDCCLNQMTNDIIESDGTFCPAIWDAWNCFKPGTFATNSSLSCPEYIFVGDPPCLPTSYKYCNSEGVWNTQTDYTTCIYSQIVRSRYEFHIIALGVSIALCIPAIIVFLIVFLIYPSFRITRVILHITLLIAIVIKNILVIVSKIYITLDSVPLVEGGPIGTVLVDNEVPCRVLAFFERVGINAMYACMVVDGFYLHKIIVTVFKKDPPISVLYMAIAVLSLVPVLIWATLKATLDNVKCWIVDESWYYWILDSSRYAMLGVNLILLLDIIRVLIWKLKKTSGLQHTKNTLRATFILVPLFGIQFIMMSQRPKNAICKWDNVFHYVSFIIDASQGILVSCLYCYFNKEVQILLKKSFQRTKTNLEFRLSHDRNVSKVRRSTAATYVSK